MTQSGEPDIRGRVLAVDYGRRRIGLAISDPTGTIATGLDTLVVCSDADAIAKIIAGRTLWEYRKIVVGIPLRTSGRTGAMAQEVLAFAERLRAACRDVPVETLDERFSSAEAARLFHAAGKRLKGRKEEIDRLAAEVLLRQYLDLHEGRSEAFDA